MRACREAGGRVMANVVVRELDLSRSTIDWMVADDFDVFKGAQLAIDSTLVCVSRSDGTAGPRAASIGGDIAVSPSPRVTS